ncbi:hypothetical protein MHL31_08535 [Lutibacter sp. A80]|uniref:hypothetical protein n=1 Tax=Lutibacter sp. A80 TaxID=2918453 RepID=UPI001F050975|nr:hypothetical protein [Lutibacter sp. A80]UMB59129.1 hypothetical protein MHL31_08535 [Lutibacter sp. A80]
MKKLKERQKLSWQGMFYSIQRIDLLIVTISGAGIYLCLETMKFLSENNQCISSLIRISGAMFLFGIIINFLSQLFGFKSNEQDFLMCQAKIDSGSKISNEEQDEIDTYDRKSDVYSKWTNRFNYLSMGFMFVGLILIMTYFLFIF